MCAIAFKEQSEVGLQHAVTKQTSLDSILQFHRSLYLASGLTVKPSDIEWTKVVKGFCFAS